MFLRAQLVCWDSDDSVLGTTGACMVEREVRVVSTLSQTYFLEKMPHQIIRINGAVVPCLKFLCFCVLKCCALSTELNIHSFIFKCGKHNYLQAYLQAKKHIYKWEAYLQVGSIFTSIFSCKYATSLELSVD